MNGSLAAASNVSVAAAATLAGSGLVGGNTTLTGGVINLSGGTLGSLSSSGGLWNGTGSVAGGLTSNGLLTIASGASLNVAAGANVNSGTLAVNGALVSGGPVAIANGVLTTIASGASFNTSNSSAVLNIDGGTLNVCGSLVASGPVNLGNTDATLATIRSGGSLTCTNASGVNLNGGTLTVNGALASPGGLWIDSATLMGAGTISGSGGVVLNNTTGTNPVLTPGPSGLAGSVGHAHCRRLYVQRPGDRQFRPLQQHLGRQRPDRLHRPRETDWLYHGRGQHDRHRRLPRLTGTSRYSPIRRGGSRRASRRLLLAPGAAAEYAAERGFRLRRHDSRRAFAGYHGRAGQSYLGRRHGKWLHKHLEPE